MTRQSPLVQFDDGELRHSFDRNEQVELPLSSSAATKSWRFRLRTGGQENPLLYPTGGWGWPPYGRDSWQKRGKRWIIQRRTFRTLSIMINDV